MRSYAGKFTLSTKPVAGMSLGQLGREYERLTLHDSAITREFIDMGRGMEKPTETRTKTDDLSVRYVAVRTRLDAVLDEIGLRVRMGRYPGKYPPTFHPAYWQPAAT
jgi:hypothetical protein